MRHRRAIIVFATTLLLVSACAYVAWTARSRMASPAAEPVAIIDGPTMGSHWLVKFGKPLDAAAAERHRLAVQSILDRIDGEMSTWKLHSDVSRFNAFRTSDWFPVRAELAATVATSQQISAEADGAFDITVAPLVNLWGFGPQRESPATAESNGRPIRRVPTDESIAAAKQHVGYQLLEVRTNPPALRKLDPQVQIDLSAIAQGYAADQVAAYLDAAGVADYLVDCGEIRARGNTPRGRPWKVGVENPTPNTLRTLGGLELRDTALATSGDYKNFFEQDGVRYSHEIDPRTGRPIQHRLAQVCVAHPSAVHADAMATALIVLGPEAGHELADRKGLAALFIIRGEGKFEIRATSAFRPMMRDTPEASPASDRSP
jgi:thiamine biosynthesis lipoprotein